MVRLVRMSVANLTVADVTLANSPYWTLSNSSFGDSRMTGSMTGFKILGQWAYNNDGLRVLRNARVEGLFVQTNDDAIVLDASGARIDDCVIWDFSNGGTFQIGWYPKTMSNIRVTNIDVIHSEAWWSDGHNSGLLAFYPAGGAGLISDLHFSNINLEGDVLRLVDLNPELGQQIDGVTFTNVNVDAWGNDLFNVGKFNQLNGNNGGSISNLTFTGLKVGGQSVLNSTYLTVGKFQLSGTVSNIVFNP